MFESRMQHYITAPWYESPEFSDITLSYGLDGSLEFKGHRLVLCSNSPSLRWKKGAINLADKYPNALESFFEFCYTGDYTLTETDVTELEIATNRYLLLARILAVAEHYECEELNCARFATDYLHWGYRSLVRAIAQRTVQVHGWSPLFALWRVGLSLRIRRARCQYRQN
jgi:hypothetical protein